MLISICGQPDWIFSVLMLMLLLNIFTNFISSHLVSTDDKPVIMVVLIHSLKAQTLSLLKCWDDSSNIVLHVHLFYQTKSGLLSCKENKSAISAIQRKLLDYAVDLKEDGAGERSQS